MNNISTNFDVARRDWLKTAVFGSAALMTGRELSAQPNTPAVKKVRGVVFMVSDGMSPGVLTLAEAYSKLTRNRSTQWWQLLNQRGVVSGFMDTASANSMVTDSAAAASAWGGGQRVNNGAVNISTAGKEIRPIAAILKEKNVRIGLVTTATVTHATPAGFAASVNARTAENDIAPQYLNRVDVILGGGSAFFRQDQRPDQHDLKNDFIKAGYEVVHHRDSLLASRAKKLLGTFAQSHLPFSIDRDHNEKLAAIIPTLTEMARAALARFLADDAPFLLQIEGARIDHAAHHNDIAGLLGDQLAFDDALSAVLTMLGNREDILLVVTSDHGNSNPGLNGMGSAYTESTRSFGRITNIKSSHEKIFTEWARPGNNDAGRLTELVRNNLDINLKANEAETLHDILTKKPVVEWNHQLSKPEGLLGQFVGNHTGIGWTGTTHTTDPTLISSLGPQAQRFTGMVRNTDVFGHLVEMLA